MNKKIVLGAIIIIGSLLHIFQGLIPEGTLKYLFNYQMIIIILGIISAIQKKSSGWIIITIGTYLYLQEFFPKYFQMGTSSLILACGIILLGLGINEKKKKDTIKNENKYSKTTINKKNDIEDAEEIK